MERGEGVRGVVEPAAMPAVDEHVQAMQVAAARQRQGVQQVEVASPWTRMKWTDAMVTLLISVVYSMGDDGEGGVGGKGGKGGAAAQAAAAQKKGKWKTVSRTMMEKGFRVSPQQCEDKFNDLNKRYKRVVDLLGRGMACRVVENNALLDAVEGLTSKAREEARKLLSSKHLFFREMCAYHNATAVAASHMATGSGGAEAACFHHPPPTPPVAPAPFRQVHPSPVVKHSPGGGSPAVDAATGNDADDDSDSYNAVSNEYDEDLEDEENEAAEIKDGGGHHHHSGGHKRGASEDAEEHGAEAKMPRTLQQLRSELAATAGGARDARQLLQWVRLRRLELEEQRMEYEAQAYQLESQRLKWLRFTAAKERQMDSLRLRNDDLLLDTRRMILMLRHKEVEFDAADTNANPGNSSSADHHPTPPPPPQQQHDSSPSTAGHPL